LIKRPKRSWTSRYNSHYPPMMAPDVLRVVIPMSAEVLEHDIGANYSFSNWQQGAEKQPALVFSESRSGRTCATS